MILVTGGTGFVGSHLIRRLHAEGQDVRVLLRPSEQSPALPKGVPVDVAISSLHDERGMRAALVGVKAIYHLVGVNWLENRLDWFETEVEGTRELLAVAKDAGVRRIIFLSHLDADRASAFSLLKAKAIVEEDIRASGLDYTIIRSSLAYGPRDNFTVPITKLLRLAPWVFPFPGDGNSLTQPIWIEDLVSCLAWSLDNEGLLNQLIEIGGPEHLTIRDILTQISAATGKRRYLSFVRPSYFRLLANGFRFIFPRMPLSNVWGDYLSNNHVTSLDGITKTFGLLPSRFSHRLDYLKPKKPAISMVQRFTTRFSKDG